MSGNKRTKLPYSIFTKENGGMHTGHNTAYSLIETELNVCIDSDDYMTDDAVKKICFLWKKFGSDQYAGLIGLNITKEGKVIGTSFPKDLKECKYSNLSTKTWCCG